jgi:hypothetical protein
MSLTDNTPAEGAGPFLFEAPELASGESYRIDLRNVEVNGKKRALRRYVPFDSVSVSNASEASAVLVTYNGQYDTRIFPNTTESFSRQGVAEVVVTNTSSTTIDAEDITVEVLREPYGADDAARDKRKRGPVSEIFENFTGTAPENIFNIGGTR